MTSADLAFKLYGTTKAEPAPKVLRAGKLTAQLANGNLRMIAYDGVEVLRGISYLVRDRDWGTYDPALSNLAITETGTGFTVSYSAVCKGPDGTLLDIGASIEGTADGQMTFKAEARSETGFETNRGGFCILHPIVGVAGTPVTVEHVDGTVEDTELPDFIDPWQPFKDMRAITHTALPGVRVECRMEDDTFEMEDQRNWSDASYKTYVRPLALPWPYQIPANDPVSQQVTLTIVDSRAASSDHSASAGNDQIIRLTPAAATGTMPAIGLLITPEEAKASLAALQQPDAPKVQELLFHFDPVAGHDARAFMDFAAIAAIHAGTTTLEIAVPCQRRLDVEMQEMAAGMRAANFAPDAIMVCPSVDRQSTPPGSQWPDCPPLQEIYAAAKMAFPGVRLGGGMLSYFTELNRKRVPGDDLAFISHCTNPIVHAADDLSVMQTLEALPFITRSVRGIYGDKAYRIGPSTIPMRQNPYGSRTMENPQGGRIAMANRDPRHNALFGAAFAMGYAIRVLDAGLESLTLSALTGSLGLIADTDEPVAAGRERPLATVVRTLAQSSGKNWRACSSSHSERALAGLVDTGEETTLLVVNITAQLQKIDVSALGSLSQGSLSVFDETTMHAGSPSDGRFSGGLVTLPPFGIARIDF